MVIPHAAHRCRGSKCIIRRSTSTPVLSWSEPAAHRIFTSTDGRKLAKRPPLRRFRFTPRRLASHDGCSRHARPVTASADPPFGLPRRDSADLVKEPALPQLLRLSLQTNSPVPRVVQRDCCTSNVKISGRPVLQASAGVGNSISPGLSTGGACQISLCRLDRLFSNQARPANVQDYGHPQHTGRGTSHPFCDLGIKFQYLEPEDQPSS